MLDSLIKKKNICLLSDEVLYIFLQFWYFMHVIILFGSMRNKITIYKRLINSSEKLFLRFLTSIMCVYYFFNCIFEPFMFLYGDQFILKNPRNFMNPKANKIVYTINCFCLNFKNALEHSSHISKSKLIMWPIHCR